MDSRAGGGSRTVRGRANPPGRTKQEPKPQSRQGSQDRQAANGRPLRIILVDDHEMVLEGLKALLARFRGRVRIVAQSVSADAAEPMVAALDPDLVVSDVRLRGSVSGLDLCRRLVETTPGRRVVLLSAYDDEQYLFQALRAGAAGYLLKSIDREELVRMLERAARGETVVDPSMAGRAVASAARLQAGEFWPGAHLGLSQRESEVLGFLVSGLSNRAIAGKLVLGEETVKTHVRSIFRKLSVNDRAGAVAVALREGIFR
ncbi:DNA-binding response regulator, NarL/FixJ family, contains REC and HTH domains [Actinopolymorpha cephalotaxi]|uniref:DNA-binding NarL/FixJ family response regulator n=1 Tax=Actinopolymorpha cephalotaxi TaxID=504797 RepID=A0A1I2YGI1_9ACTN|nr:response regulator transcription factor [Actinopolymorpha cephalotaxi]NYH86993.1 DNA-binding NarL/FixJ family response regulator [Actinopolymorpha cephalotaxi]SFH24479.1 DNA-binding response regulator, NarL/FixJ family, contains REC and HTH domains [Actinopolymorpha cephalotaxi]